MPRRALVSVAFCATAAWAALCAVGPLRAAPPPHPRLLLISVDGLMPSSYTASGQKDAQAIRALAARGAWADAVTGVWPTNTRPSHTSLITGVPPGTHGIVDNDILDPERRSNRTFNWFAGDVKVPTLVDAARAAGMTTGVVMWPVSIGLDVDFLVPSFNWNAHTANARLLRALSTPRLIERFERETGATLPWPPTHRLRAAVARFLIGTHSPDVLLVYFGTLDAFEHTYGPEDPMTASALRDVDRLVAEVLEALDAHDLRDTTYVALVSDHGYIEVEQGVGPNTALRTAGLIETDNHGAITTWRAYSHGTGGSSLVYLSDPTDTPAREQARAVLVSLAADPRAGIERVLDRDDLIAAGADPAATFGLAMRPGYTLLEDTDRLFGRPYIDAMHGYPPAHAAMNASLIVTGPGLTGVGSLGTVRMTQIAPTLARLLGLTLSPKADQPLDAVLRAAAR